MKWLLIILIFNSTIAIGQTEDSTKYIWYKAQYGQRMPRSWWDSVAHMPYGDTATFPKPTRPGAIMMHIDKHFYKWNGGGWDAMGGGSATLSNQGSGFRLVKTSNGQLKTLVGSYGVLPDSSSNTDAITLNADTSSTNHLVTQSDLNDSAGALRAAIGTGGGSPGGNNFDIQFKNSSSTFGGSSRFTWDTTNKRVSIFNSSTVDLTRKNDFALKIIGSRMYLGDTASNDPTIFEMGNPYGTSKARMFTGWLGSREYNYGYNLDYRVTGEGQHQYHDTTEPILYTFLDPTQQGIQVVPKGYSNIDYGTGFRQDVYSLFGRVIKRWDWMIGPDYKYYGSRLTLNELLVMDTLGMSKEMTTGYAGHFSNSGTSLRYGGTLGWLFADSVDVGIGGTIQTGFKTSINTNSTNNTKASLIFYNDGDNTSFNKIRFDKVVSGSHNVGAGVKNPYIDISGGVAEEGWISTSNAPGGFSNYEKYWKTTNSSGSFAERMRLSESGNLGIGVTSPTAVLHLKAGTATANTAPLKFTSGTPTTTPETGAMQFNNGLFIIDSSNSVRDTIATRSWARNNIAGSSGITSINSQTGSSQTISAGPGLAVSSSSDVHTISFNNTLDYQVSDANNVGTSATDLYSKTVAANQFTLNGQSIHFEAAGITNDATATVNLEALFAGNGIAGTGAIAIAATGAWTITGTIIRATSTTARLYTTVTLDGKTYLSTSNLTGLDWTATNVLKIRATAGGGGGGSNDITAQMWKVVFQP